MITVEWTDFVITLNCVHIHMLTYVSWEVCAFSNRSGFHWSIGATNESDLPHIVIIEFSC